MITPMPSPFKLSVVVIFLNEEETLPELVRRLRAVMQDQKGKGILSGHELIFVNDASTDRSLQVLKDLDQGHGDIRVINMTRRFGISPSIMAGLNYAEGDAVVFMESDLQDPPEIIPEMIKAWQDEGADVVHTVRLSRQGEPAFKLWITGIGYFILNRFSNIPILKEAGDFKLLSRRAARQMTEFKEQRPFIRGLVCWMGFKQVVVKYHRHPRYKGESKYFVLGNRVIDNFLNSALINFSAMPLQIASWCGVMAILVDLGLVVHVLIQKLTGHAAPGWSAMMIAVLFIGGVQLFCIGLIGLYVNSIHAQVQGRPVYIVESTYGFKPKGA